VHLVIRSSHNDCERLRFGIVAGSNITYSDCHLTVTYTRNPITNARKIVVTKDKSCTTPCLSSGDRSALTLTVLKNAKYRLNSVYKNEDAQLENGVYHRPGTSAQNNYIKIDGPTAYGDLNGDGRGDAAVILRDWGGGTGVSVNLAVVIDQNGKPYNIATQALGDRVHILSSCVLSEVVTLNMLVPGPNEGFCCPTQQVMASWKLVNNTLVRVP
jgi:hypothetical protein